MVKILQVLQGISHGAVTISSQPASVFFPQERMLRRREKLWDLEKELESVHTKSKSYKPKCLCW